MTGAFAGPVEVPGGRIWAEAAGSGPAVLLIHAGIADARMWDPQWAPLAAGHRVIRYDTRGFGRTRSEDVSFSNRADAIAVLDALGVERATLIGCSRGGSIALDTALEFPHRATGLVWVCGGVGGLETEPLPEEQEAGGREEALWEAKDWAALADFDVTTWVDGLGQPPGRAPAAVRDLVHQMCLETYTQELEEGRPVPLRPPAAGRLGEVAVPTLVIQGDLDTPSTRAAAGVVTAGIPGARRLDVPGVAHLPSLERPEWFTATLLEFLAEGH